jgi:hypothetical protein
MQCRVLLIGALTLAASVIQAGSVLAQTTNISDAECQGLRQKLSEHARLSEGVRRAVAAQAAAVPATTGGAAASAPAPSTGRADAIRARLAQIPAEHQALEDQRLGAVVKFDLSRAAQVQGQMQTLDTEKANLEQELAALPASASAPAAKVAPPTATDPTSRIVCKDMPAAVTNAMKTRRHELGARDEQAGAIPLVGLKGQTAEQIGQELAAQFSPGAAATNQVGLLDSDGNGQLDGVVDVPAPGVVRLVRQRGDGTLSVEVFATPGSSATAGYGEVTRRLDETTARQWGQPLPEIVATRPAGPSTAIVQTAEFAQAYAQYQAGSFAEAARLTAPAARSRVYSNLRGQNVRVLEIISPATGGVSLRRTVVLAQPNDQELWEETTTILRPVSYWRTDVEVTRSRETRSTAGAIVGTPVVSAPSKFSLER